MALYKDLRYYDETQADFIARKLLALRDSLYDQITRDRRPNSLIVGSWNIREFDSGKGGERLDESYHYLAEIIDRFDICAVQEIRDDLEPLENLVRLLGPDWDYFVTDVTAGSKGNRERQAFLYNRNRMFFRNLIGEIVLPDKSLVNGLQFARTPFFAAFQAQWFRFVLCSVHMFYGADRGAKKAQRVAEIDAIAKEVAKRAAKENEVYILLGDMNVVDRDDETYKALAKHKLMIPNFGPTNLLGTKFYDQLVFTGEGERVRMLRHGTLDWRDIVFLPEEQDYYEPLGNVNPDKPDGKRYKNWDRGYKTWATHQMSDHLPLWVELEIDYSDEYLARFVV